MSISASLMLITGLDNFTDWVYENSENRELPTGHAGCGGCFEIKFNVCIITWTCADDWWSDWHYLVLCSQSLKIWWSHALTVLLCIAISMGNREVILLNCCRTWDCITWVYSFCSTKPYAGSLWHLPDKWSIKPWMPHLFDEQNLLKGSGFTRHLHLRAASEMGEWNVSGSKTQMQWNCLAKGVAAGETDWLGATPPWSHIIATVSVVIDGKKWGT